jgi:predicted CopG family antitoxin
MEVNHQSINLEMLNENEKEILDRLNKLKVNKESESELLAKLEKIKKENNFNQQRQIISNKIRKFMIENMEEDITEKIAMALIIEILNVTESHFPNLNQQSNISFYLKETDENKLLAKKLINKFARKNEIRYEDSRDVIFNFLSKIRPSNYKYKPEKQAERNIPIPIFSE